MNLLVLLLPLVILITWARLVRPGANRLQGDVLLTTPLPLLARIRMHAIPASVALALGVYLVMQSAMPVWALGFPVVSDVLLLAVPVNYTLTDQGLRLGYGPFRRWTEFTGVRRAPGGARLLGMQRHPGMHIWLSGSRGDDEFLQYLRQTIKQAYKGTRTVIPFPTNRAAPPGGGEDAYISRSAEG